MDRSEISPDRRDLILMTGLAAVGAVAAIRPRPPAEPGTSGRDAIINVRDHGARGDGAQDDTEAIVAALERAASSGEPSTLYFPRGVYPTKPGAMTISEEHPVLIRGDGPGATTIALAAGGKSSSALLALDAPYAAVQDVRFDGGTAKSGSDLVVLNRGYTRISNCLLSRAPGTALAIGKTARALAHIVENVVIRDSGAYGIRVHGSTDKAATGSTDGLWSNVDVGRSGLSGVLLESSSQNLSNVHVWQSGTRSNDSTDQNGFRVVSRSHIFVGCQAERNHGDGFRFEGTGGEGSILSGCRIWENGGSGVVGVDTDRLSIAASTFVRNGRNNVGNVASRTARGAAAIRNEGGSEWSVVGCSVWDDERELDPVEVPPDSSTPKIPPRGRRRSQTFAYVETGDAGRSVITGGVMRAEEQFSGQAIQSSSPGLRVLGVDLGDDTVPTVDSADSIEVPPWAEVVNVSGTTPITSIGPGRPGKSVMLIFSASGAGGLRSSDGGLRLDGDFVPNAGGAITLVNINGAWFEQSRIA